MTVLLMVVSEPSPSCWRCVRACHRSATGTRLRSSSLRGATFYFLAFDIAPSIHLIPEWIAVYLQVIGMSIQTSAKLSLRRSFGILLANRGVVVLLHWTLQIVCILREKRLLSDDASYREYEQRVKYCLITGIFLIDA